MTVLVVYASRHGATGQIAARVAVTLTAAGQPADARAAEDVGDVAGYDAFVVGASVYYGHWHKAAAEFIRAHQGPLVDRPVWLFSSGPLGTETADAQGHDPREAAAPEELDGRCCVGGSGGVAERSPAGGQMAMVSSANAAGSR